MPEVHILSVEDPADPVLSGKRLSSLTMESDTEKSKAWIFTRWNRKFVSYVGFELQYLLGL